ncbi:hypothetical protein [Cupriavidus pauculus]|uniref:hypothetical protein n=1 Tax=Cupriavidus pauculus TaxID=82633 RepID=UPI001FD5BC92|nr:hypothetical protein [Cupriavidus pauculus]
MKSQNIKAAKQIAVVAVITSALGTPLYYAIESGNDRLIGIIFAVMMPIMFCALFRSNFKKYRHTTESQRKLAKLQSDLPLLITGVSLALTLVTQGFISEWNDGWKIVERMEPGLTTISTFVNSKECAIPRRTATPCFAAKESLKEIHQQIISPSAEQMRSTLQKLRGNVFIMVLDEPVDARERLRDIMAASISDMERHLPPQMLWLKWLSFPLALLSVLIFLVSGSMRFALSWVEWETARRREGYPA